MPEPEGPEDERFVYVMTAAGVEALREGAAAADSEQEPQSVIDEQRFDVVPSAKHD